MARFRCLQQSVAILSVIVTLVNAAQADDFYEKTPLPSRLIPEYLPCVFNEERYACFSADQMVSLYALEAQARYWHAHWQTNSSLLGDKQLQLGLMQKQLSIAMSMSNRDADFIDALTKDYIKATEDRNHWRVKAENPPLWPLWLGGGLAVFGAGAFIAGLVIR